MIVSKNIIPDNKQTFYQDGKFLFPKNNFNKLWACQIHSNHPKFIFDRLFLKKKETDTHFYFEAPRDGFYEFYGEKEDGVLNNYVHVKSGLPDIVSFTLVKLGVL